MRHVMVAQDESEASLAALSYADALAVAYGASLTGLMFGLVPSYPMSLASAAAPDGWMAAQRQASEEAALSENRLRALYVRLAAPNELKRVDAFEQEVGRLCARRARTADLTVIGWSHGGGADIERSLFEACLFDSGRPVLIAPLDSPARAPPTRILVAWNGSRESARALRESLPMLRHSRATRVVAVDVEDSDFADGDEPWVGLERYLALHNIVAEGRRAHSGGRNVATVLADEADQFGAGLIVLGGFGFMRAGQWTFGDTTRAALTSARLPMLFAN